MRLSNIFFNFFYLFLKLFANLTKIRHYSHGEEIRLFLASGFFCVYTSNIYLPLLPPLTHGGFFLFMNLNLIEQLKRHEGFRSNYYRCSAGKLTIGYGRNVDDNPFTDDELAVLGRCSFDDKPMTKDEAELLLLHDLERTENAIKDKIECWSALNNARKAVCVNMAFNLGIAGFCKFKHMISALNDLDYERAAREMLDSKWAKQVKSRASELAVQMSTGEWQ